MSIATTFIGGDDTNCEESPQLRRITSDCVPIPVFEWDDDPQASEFIITLKSGVSTKGLLLCPGENTSDLSRPLYQSSPYGCSVGAIDDPTCDHQLPIVHRARRVYTEQDIDTSWEVWQEIADRFLDNGIRRRFLPSHLLSPINTLDLQGMGIGEDYTEVNDYTHLGEGSWPPIIYTYRINSLFPLGSVSYETPFEATMPYTVNYLNFRPIPSFGFSLEYGEESRYVWYLDECLAEDVPDDCSEEWKGCTAEYDVGTVISEQIIHHSPQIEKYRRLSTTSEELDADNQYLEQRQTVYPGYILHDGTLMFEEQEEVPGEDPVVLIKNNMYRDGTVWKYKHPMEDGGCIELRLQARYGWNEPFLRDPTVGLEKTYFSTTGYSQSVYAISPPVIKKVTVTECWSPDGSIEIESEATCAFMDVYVDGVPDPPGQELGNWSPIQDLTTGTYNVTINTYSEITINNSEIPETIRCNGPTVNRTINVVEPSPEIECRGFDAWEKIFDEDTCGHKWQLLEECSETCNCFPGCVDANACNYDDTATYDDGSCWYPETGDATEEYCSGTQRIKEVYVGDCSNATETQVIASYTCDGCYNPISAGTACNAPYCSGLSVVQDRRQGDCANTCSPVTLANCDCSCNNATCVNYKYDHDSRTLTRNTIWTFVDGYGDPCSKWGTGYYSRVQGNGTCQAGTYTFGINCCVGGDYGSTGTDASGNPKRLCYLGSYGGYDVYFYVWKSKYFNCTGCIIGTGTLTVTCGGAYCP